MKYHFCIRFENTTINSAATKAVADCTQIFAEQGYKNFTFNVRDNSNKLKYYFKLLVQLINFFASLKKGSLVAIQYPLLSIVNVFHFLIRLGKFKKIKFYCIIHDLESLRTGGMNAIAVKNEVTNLNYFDLAIVHNNEMEFWLKENGLKIKTVTLTLFDYLSDQFVPNQIRLAERTVVFAGNLSKSAFIYKLSPIETWHFNVYGPNFQSQNNVGNFNLKWCGEFGPEQITNELSGNFGLIWDGKEIDKCDEILGNYLLYNNPHKFSLYLAAGLPVIAPANSAISTYIKQNQIGVLINSLEDLIDFKISDEQYSLMKANVEPIRKRIINGDFFREAIIKTEFILRLE